MKLKREFGDIKPFSLFLYCWTVIRPGFPVRFLESMCREKAYYQSVAVMTGEFIIECQHLPIILGGRKALVMIDFVRCGRISPPPICFPSNRQWPNYKARLLNDDFLYTSHHNPTNSTINISRPIWLQHETCSTGEPAKLTAGRLLIIYTTLPIKPGRLPTLKQPSERLSF